MPKLEIPFNALQYDPTQGSGVLPVGKHSVIIEASEIRPTKEQDGSAYLQFQLRITEGAFKGMGGAHRLQLYNRKSEQTVAIANKQLSAICHVTGVFNVQDTSQLHNIPFIIEVGYQKGSEQYTEVKRVLDANGNEPGKAALPPQQSATPQSSFQPSQQPQSGWSQPQQAPVAQQPQHGWGAPPPPAPAQQSPQQQGWGQPQQAPQPTPQPAWGQPQPQLVPQPQQPPQQGWGAPQQPPQAPNGAQPGQQSGPPPWGRPQG